MFVDIGEGILGLLEFGEDTLELFDIVANCERDILSVMGIGLLEKQQQSSAKSLFTNIKLPTWKCRRSSGSLHILGTFSIMRVLFISKKTSWNSTSTENLRMTKMATGNSRNDRVMWAHSTSSVALKLAKVV